METDFNDVVERKRGSERESSLFYFVNDWFNEPKKNIKNSILCSCHCQKGSGKRPVYFISKQDKSYEPKSIFADYKLVDCHLSVDKYYSLDSAASASTFYRASHITMVFKNNRTVNEGRVIRIYFNPEAQLTSNPIHMMNCRLTNNNHVDEQIGDSLKLSELEKNAVYENRQFQQHKVLLNELTKEKLNTFMDKRNFSYQLSEQLAQEFECKNWTKAKELALTLKELTEKITCYNDEIIDGRTNYLNNLIQLYERLINKSLGLHDLHEKIDMSRSKTEDCTMVPLLSELKSPSVTQTAGSETEETILKNKIQRLVSSINQINTNDHTDLAKKLLDRQPLLQEFDESCLILSGADTTPKEIKQFIRKQNQILSNNLSIVEYFKNAVLYGDLEQVVQLHEIVSSRYNLLELYTTLLSDILSLDFNKEDTAYIEMLPRKVAIADYFYNTSTLFKSMAKLFQYTMIADSLNNIRSYLVTCFIMDNWNGFQMLLRQKMPLNEVHFIKGCHALNALQSIISVYASNPKPEYIRCLLEEGASTKFSILWHQAPQFTELETNQKGLKTKTKPLNFNLSLFPSPKSDRDQLDKMIQHVIVQKNALQLVQKIYGFSHPELIELFIHHVRLDEAILALVQILSSTTFRTLYIFGHELLKIHEIDDSQIIFKNKDSFIEHWNSKSPLTNDCYIPRTFYYLTPNTENSDILWNHIFSITKNLKTKFQQESFDNQKIIILNILLSQKKEFKTKDLASQLSKFDFHQLIFFSASIQLTYTWMPRHDDEYVNLWITQSFEHVHSILNQVNTPSSEFIAQKKSEIQNNYRYFLKNLCDHGLVKIKTIPVDKVALEGEGEDETNPNILKIV